MNNVYLMKQETELQTHDHRMSKLLVLVLLDLLYLAGDEAVHKYFCVHWRLMQLWNLFLHLVLEGKLFPLAMKEQMKKDSLEKCSVERDYLAHHLLNYLEHYGMKYFKLFFVSR